MFRVLFLVLPLTLVSCLSPHRIEIQQGNFVTQEMVNQLKPGMTRDQVRFVLGTPLVSDLYHANRWDYVYTRQPMDSSDIEQRKIAVLFEDGKLSRIVGTLAATSGASAFSGKAR